MCRGFLAINSTSKLELWRGNKVGKYFSANVQPWFQILDGLNRSCSDIPNLWLCGQQERERKWKKKRSRVHLKGVFQFQKRNSIWSLETSFMGSSTLEIRWDSIEMLRKHICTIPFSSIAVSIAEIHIREVLLYCRKPFPNIYVAVSDPKPSSCILSVMMKV